MRAGAKRVTGILALLLLAGAVVNVAVAGVIWWSTGCSLEPVGRAMYHYPDKPPVNELAIERWTRHAKGTWPEQTTYLNRLDTKALGTQHQYLYQQIASGGMLRLGDTGMRDLWLRAGMWEVMAVECGWPVHCVAIEGWREKLEMELTPASWYPVPRKTPAVLEHDGWSVLGRPVPRRPRWPGLLVNTGFYAALLWLLIPGPIAMWRLIRRHRGLCVRCGYPAGESRTCSECGAALPGAMTPVMTVDGPVEGPGQAVQP